LSLISCCMIIASQSTAWQKENRIMTLLRQGWTSVCCKFRGRNQ
jgi:hypothetical protein